MSSQQITMEELGKTFQVLVKVEIEYSYSPGSDGSYWEPPEPPEFEFESVTVLEYSTNTTELKRDNRPDWFDWLDEIVWRILENNPDKYQEQLEFNHEDDRFYDE